MSIDAQMKKQLEEDRKEVNKFYEKALENILKKNNDNLKEVKRLEGLAKNIEKEIDNLKKEKDDIMNNQSNHVNGEIKNRLKNFGLEKDIFDIENKIKKLEKKLELQNRINEIEIADLKEKNKNYWKEYDKYYNEHKQIDEAMFTQFLGMQIDLGGIKSAEEIKKQNDDVFANLMK